MIEYLKNVGIAFCIGNVILVVIMGGFYFWLRAETLKEGKEPWKSDINWKALYKFEGMIILISVLCALGSLPIFKEHWILNLVLLVCVFVIVPRIYKNTGGK